LQPLEHFAVEWRHSSLIGMGWACFGLRHRGRVKAGFAGTNLSCQIRTLLIALYGNFGDSATPDLYKPNSILGLSHAEGIPAFGLKGCAASIRPQKDDLFLARDFTDDGYGDALNFTRQAAREFLRHGK
jgi:hypothetical protein